MTDKKKLPPAWLITLRRRLRHLKESISILFNLPNLYHGQRRDHAAVVSTLQSMTALMNQTNARLRWYENRVPLIKKEYLAFKKHEAKLIRAEKAKQQLADGLFLPQQVEIADEDHEESPETPTAEMGVRA